MLTDNATCCCVVLGHRLDIARPERIASWTVGIVQIGKGGFMHVSLHGKPMYVYYSPAKTDCCRSWDDMKKILLL